MNIHFIQHEIFEAPGAYLDWAHARGYQTAFSHVYAGQSLPTSVQNIDMLIVLGGPQSPATTRAECPYFDSAAEQALIRQCIDAGKAVLGVCLGAQLIGEALGAKYAHSPEREIGNFPLFFTPTGKHDAKFAAFTDGMPIGHWHNDMPGLTDKAEILAYSAGCPRQIIRYGTLVYGLQCHAELNNAVVRLLIDAEGDLAAQSRQYKFVQPSQAILDFDYRPMNQALYGFLDQLVITYRG